MARETALASLRELAGGKPLMGTSVQTQFDKNYTPEEMKLLATQFDSVTPENCMKWQYLCPRKAYIVSNHRPPDGFRHETPAKRRRPHPDFQPRWKLPDWLFRDGGKEADAKLVWKRIEDHAAKLMSRYAGTHRLMGRAQRIHRSPRARLPRDGSHPRPRCRLPGALVQDRRRIDPKAKMTYNDFSVENPTASRPSWLSCASSATRAAKSMSSAAKPSRNR
jgi:GH35 family endo-1,4-beta-xylanase